MVSSKELLVILRLLAAVTHEDKEIMLNYLSCQQDSEDNLEHPAFFLEEAVK